MVLKQEIKWLDAYIKKLVKQNEDVWMLRAILQRLKREDNKEPPNAYHNQAVGYYKQWLITQGLPAIVNPRQGKAMKDILSQLKTASKDKTEESAYHSFIAILTHWNRVGEYHIRRKQLAHINENLLDIIDKIKNGTTRQSINIMEAHQVHDELSKKYSTGNGADG
ncbi:hypothetical protein [Sphingobacterium spiritivorum]